MDYSILRQCFGSFMTGVTIVTTIDKDLPVGFTANSFSSVSLNPPLLLICIDNGSENIASFTGSEKFGVNILADNQESLSNRFSSQMGNRFDGITWHISEHGNPELDGISAFFDCRLENTHITGDHTILIGQILDCHMTENAGLGYYQGRYFTLNTKDE